MRQTSPAAREISGKPDIQAGLPCPLWWAWLPPVLVDAAVLVAVLHASLLDLCARRLALLLDLVRVHALGLVSNLVRLCKGRCAALGVLLVLIGSWKDIFSAVACSFLFCRQLGNLFFNASFLAKDPFPEAVLD